MAFPLPLLAIAGTAWILSSCSRNDKPEETSAKKIDRYSPPSDTTYQKKCIDEPTCSKGTRIASVYDYVGYIYGEKGKVKYDGILQAGERQYVESNFGRLTDPQNISRYLQIHQVFALQKYATGPDDPSCRQLQNWKVLLGKHPELGEAYVIGSVHHCFEYFSGMMEALALEQKIAADPEDWLFLVESTVSNDVMEQMGKGGPPQDEVAIIQNMADKLGIPTGNALIPVDHEAVILQLENEGETRLEQAKFHLLGQVNNSIIREDPAFRERFYQLSYHERSRVMHQRLTDILVTKAEIHPQIEVFAKTFGVSIKDLYKACADYLEVPKGIDTATHYENILSQIEKKFSHFIEVSNHLSEAHIKGLIKNYGKKKVLAQLGAGHAEIFYNLYPDVQEFAVAGAVRR